MLKCFIHRKADLCCVIYVMFCLEADRRRILEGLAYSSGLATGACHMAHKEMTSDFDFHVVKVHHNLPTVLL